MGMSRKERGAEFTAEDAVTVRKRAFRPAGRDGVMAN